MNPIHRITLIASGRENVSQLHLLPEELASMDAAEFFGNQLAGIFYGPAWAREEHVVTLLAFCDDGTTRLAAVCKFALEEIDVEEEVLHEFFEEVKQAALQEVSRRMRELAELQYREALAAADRVARGENEEGDAGAVTVDYSTGALLR